MYLNDTERLEAYLHAEAKYYVLPVPTPLDRRTAVEFIAKHLPPARDVETVWKLARVAILHDLRETAPLFLAVPDLGEKAPPDAARSAAAVEAVAWVGDDAQFDKARTYFRDMARRADLLVYREALLDAAYALGPRGDGPAALRAAAAEDVAALERDAATAGQKPGVAVEVLVGFQNKIAALREFMNLEIPRLEKANDLRKTIEAQPPEARAPRLVELYVGDAPDATPRVAWCAGMMLVRLTTRDAAPRPVIARQFAVAAQLFARPDEARQATLDARRARALRAEDFFGGLAELPRRMWLAQQKDVGADPLALRPNWEYPLPHHH